MASEVVEVSTPIYDQLTAETWPPEDDSEGPAAAEMWPPEDPEDPAYVDPTVIATPTTE